ncbi:hypothetical protein TWF696_007449 [Orbilia brochopaga]|uniref:Spherulation-specific family 4 n=1 Tax=Orbilia brochopaga TaxID=3140254 RepID=A0AAV9UNX3_9PEZI
MVNVLSVIFPLYLYPADCSSPSSSECAWAPFFRTVQTNPSIIFNFIININSGPGTVNQVPSDGNWQKVIAYANGLNNTRLIGYIDSNPARIPPSIYNPQIQTYKNWASYEPLDLHMDGIFVDDMAHSLSSASYYKLFVENIKSIWAAAPKAPTPYIVMNPGSPIDCNFYSNVGSIVSFEDYYSALNNAPFIKAPYTNCPRYKQTVIIHDFTGSAAEQQRVSDDLGETFRVGNIFITSAIQTDTQNPYDDVPPLLQQLGGSVKSTNSWILAHPQWYPNI